MARLALIIFVLCLAGYALSLAIYGLLIGLGIALLVCLIRRPKETLAFAAFISVIGLMSRYPYFAVAVTILFIIGAIHQIRTKPQPLEQPEPPPADDAT